MTNSVVTLGLVAAFKYSKTCHSKRRPKLGFKTDYSLMQVKSIEECSKGEHSAIHPTFIRLLFVFKTFVLSIFQWQLKTGLTVQPLHFKDFLLNVNVEKISVIQAACPALRNLLFYLQYYANDCHYNLSLGATVQHHSKSIF